MKVTVIKGPFFQKTEKEVYKALSQILIKKAKEETK